MGIREEAKQPERAHFENYIDRCKKIGRVGPSEVKIDNKSIYGDVLLTGRDNLDIEAISSFCSVRANVGVFSGRYYYEVQLRTSGLMQIGWCTIITPFNSQRGVGDDPTSFAYDGYRVKKWNRENQSFGEAWSVGDIVGTLIDFDKKEISFWRNNKFLGKAFSHVKSGMN